MASITALSSLTGEKASVWICRLRSFKAAGIRPGDRVDVLGIPAVYLKKSVVLFKLHVHAASVIEASAGGRGPEPVKNVEGTISHLKELGFKRIPFPKRATAISVIHSKSHAANVFADFKNELDLKSVNVESLPTAMTDPSAIARAIDQASGNVVVLIRGGGDDAEFTTFQHDDVVKALARKAAHRITGLGHYGNLTYADIIADFCTTTPTSAGAYVRGATDPYLQYAANGKGGPRRTGRAHQSATDQQAQMDARCPRGNRLGGVSRVFPLDKDNG